MAASRTADDVWREIITGSREEKRSSKMGKKLKVEIVEKEEEEMMTLEDFLVKAGAVDDQEHKKQPENDIAEEEDVKVKPIEKGHSFDSIQLSPFPSGEWSVGKKTRSLTTPLVNLGMGFEVMDKAAQQRQRRMIKNRESAARSRERKQAYQVELETLAVKLEEENKQLLKEQADRTKERYKLLMEKIVPVVEMRRPPKVLRRVRSLQW